jgi:hypothetical protein
MVARVIPLLAAIAAGPAIADATVRIIVQQSPLAGFRHYDGAALWEGMRVGDTLGLVREPDNPHDANAVRIEWSGHKVGYVPRTDNAHVARQMDRGAAPLARITALHKTRNGRHRVSYEISVPLR